VRLRCYLESLLRIHRPDCEHCNPHETWGLEVRKRLEDLNSRTQSYSPNNHEEVVRVVEPKPPEVVANPSPLAREKKIV
jgi:hypothetical protein